MPYDLSEANSAFCAKNETITNRETRGVESNKVPLSFSFVSHFAQNAAFTTL